MLWFIQWSASYHCNPQCQHSRQIWLAHVLHRFASGGSRKKCGICWWNVFTESNPTISCPSTEMTVSVWKGNSCPLISCHCDRLCLYICTGRFWCTLQCPKVIHRCYEDSEIASMSKVVIVSSSWQGRLTTWTRHRALVTHCQPHGPVPTTEHQL